MRNRLIHTGIALTLIFTVSCASQNNQQGNGEHPAPPQAGRQQGPPNYSQLLAQMDQDRDGKLAKSEVKGPLANDFDKVDVNEDGYITEDELNNAPRPSGNRR